MLNCEKLRTIVSIISLMAYNIFIFGMMVCMR